MNKKLLAVIVSFAASFAAQAATATFDGVTYEYNVLNSGKATITKVTSGDAKIVNIPRKIGEDEDVVTVLGYGSFLNNTTVQKIVIPETVTSIGDSAFQGCLALTTCNIPSGVTSIPHYCFYGCSKLKRIMLPSGIKSIGDQAFYNCSSLENVEFSDGLQTIRYSAFNGCDSLTTVNLPDTVTSIGNWCFGYCYSLATVHLPTGLKTIPHYCFYYCNNLRTINIPDNLTGIESYAFNYCNSLREVTVPASVTSIGDGSFYYVGRVIFLGRPPAGLASAGVSTAVYPKEYGELYAAQFSIANTGGFAKPNKPVATVVSAAVRESDPTVLDVVYKVTSAKPTVKVRALAFEDGVRSFANVTRPETFIDGTAANIGDAVAANVEHTLSWKVSSDFKTDLAKMKFEVFAVEDGILPLELTTIPANGTNKAMELSWNLLTEAQVFDALLWLYADGDSGLTLENGALKNGNNTLANGMTISLDGWYFRYDAIPYVFSKMDFSALSGDALNYANDMTRLGLSPDGIRQYAYRWVEAQ